MAIATVFLTCSNGGSSTPNPLNIGKKWSLLATSGSIWSARFLHEVISYDNVLYVVGGRNANSDGPSTTYYNDIWKSTDGGSSWIEVTADGGFSARWGHKLLIHNNQFYKI